MKRYDIDKIFAKLLGEYIADGYVINTNTMGGSQGEVAKVDLKKGSDFLRMTLQKTYGGWGEHDGYVLVIGRSAKAVRDRDGEIVWTNDLEEIARHPFWQIGTNWFTGIKEYADECYKKHWDRAKARYWKEDPMVSHEVDLPASCNKIVLDRVRNLPKCKSVKLSDIKRVVKIRRGDANEYLVDVRDRRLSLGIVKVA